MKTLRHLAFMLTIALALFAAGCATETTINSNANAPGSPSPAVSPSTTPVTKVVPVTLPVLDALFSDDAFKTKLKGEVELNDEQVAQLQKIASEEVARLRQLNTEELAEGSDQSRNGREHAAESIRGVIGEQKAEKLFSFAHAYWVAGNEGVPSAATPSGTPVLNGVPTDTRVVVNIPAYRMDVFKEGALVKSYKIGIGYPDFPLPTGLRKAQSIIFNPTWTPPDEPWVAKMNVTVGEKVEAGSKLNPLGPIKIPIGLPSLIHGGKAQAKLGAFASHGCVGLTTPQVQDFAKLLAQISGGEITDAEMKSYFADKTKTKVEKLDNAVPVELRYETIVVEDGKLHIYKDVYDQDANTEENLRAVFAANGIRLEDLSESERAQVLEALNAMSRRPAKAATTSPSPAVSPVAGATPKDPDQKVAKAPAKKPIGKNQKVVVIELTALKGKGYPAAVNFDTGSGKPSAVATGRPETKPSPKGE